jgi:hypothetical protein
LEVGCCFDRLGLPTDIAEAEEDSPGRRYVGLADGHVPEVRFFGTQRDDYELANALVA